MNKQCINCQYDKAPPNRKCACFTKVKYPLINIVEMKSNSAGYSYCSGFKQARGSK